MQVSAVHSSINQVPGATCESDSMCGQYQHARERVEIRLEPSAMSFTKLDDLGLKKAPSCYALFKADLAKRGLRTATPTKRLTRKTLANLNPSAKWRVLPETEKNKFREQARLLAKNVQEEKKRLLAAREPDSSEQEQLQRADALDNPLEEVVVRQSDGETWRRVAKLGSGTYGSVWAFKSQISGAGLAGKECASLADLEKERRLIWRFRSPYVISAFDYALGPGNMVVLLMERANACLCAFLASYKDKDNGLDGLDSGLILERWQFLHQLCLGLQHIHSHDILHLDMKSANVLVFPTSHSVKISDFGLAEKFDKRDGTCIAKGREVFTAIYRAPELLEADGQECVTGPESDTFALGCTLTEIEKCEGSLICMNTL